MTATVSASTLRSLRRRWWRLTTRRDLRSWSAVIAAVVVLGAVTPTAAAPILPAAESPAAESTEPTDGGDQFEVLVTDVNQADSIGRFTAEGELIATLEPDDGLLGSAQAIAIGPDGLAYVAGAETGGILRFDLSDGSVADVVVESKAGLDNPRGLAFDSAGHLLVTSAGTDEVVSFDPESGDRIGVVASDGLDNPGGMFMASDGTLFVASQRTDSVIGFDADGLIEVEIDTGPGSGPVDVAAGPSGELYVAMADAGRIDRIVLPDDGTDNATEPVMEPFVTDGLVTPSAVSIGPDGAVWVADQWNGTLHRFDLTTGEDLGSVLQATNASFGPTDLAFVPLDTSPQPSPNTDDSPIDTPATQDPAEDDVASRSIDGLSDRGIALTGPTGTDRLFELNRGQFDSTIDAALRIAGRGISLVDGRLLIDSPGARGGNVVGLGLAGADPDVAPTGEDSSDGPTISYFVGELAVTGVERQQQLRYDDLLPGVDVRYTAERSGVTYDLLLDAGVDPDTLELTVDGAESVSVDRQGRLVVRQKAGPPLRFSAPVSYQLDGDERIDVVSAYVIDDDGTLGFEVGELESGLPLVIDPTLDLSTYVGGTGDDLHRDVAIDGSGNIVIVGDSTSSNYPTTAGAYDTTFNSNTDIVVSKLDPTGSTLLWSTFVGGSGADYARELAVAADSTVYVVGNTSSSNFPTTGGAYDTTNNGSIEAVVVALSSTGTALTASTYLGSSNIDDAESVDLDPAGNVVVLGNTQSTAFPTTGGAYDTTHNGSTDLFVAKLTPSLASLTWSTFVGGSGSESAGMIDVDGSGGVWFVTGTSSSNMATSAGAFDTALSGSNDFWVGGLSSTGSTLAYGTYLGGTGSDVGPSSIHAVDATQLHVATIGHLGLPDHNRGLRRDGFQFRHRLRCLRLHGDRIRAADLRVRAGRHRWWVRSRHHGGRRRSGLHRRRCVVRRSGHGRCARYHAQRIMGRIAGGDGPGGRHARVLHLHRWQRQR